MTEPERICAFYSRGPHFMRLLAFLREQHPQAHITALVPPEYPKEHLRDRADAVMEAAKARYVARDLSGIRELLSRIRAERFHEFVVMFDSPRLRLFAAFTGAPRRSCYTIDGRYFPLKLSPLRVACSTLWRAARGRMTYAYVYLNVRFRRVETAKHRD